jgi:hypothetical protein
MLAEVHPSIAMIKMAKQGDLKMGHDDQRDGDTAPAIESWDAIHFSVPWY